MRRVGNNRTGYAGERIDVAQVLGCALEAAEAAGWIRETLDLPEGEALVTLMRIGDRRGPRVYLSSGIHGDEPAGPLAICRLIEEDDWPPDAQLWICPCLNPTGFALNRRENRDGHDLNRDYRNRRTMEVDAHVRWLERQPSFDLALLIHEDWEAPGFYLYELNPDRRPSLAEPMVAAAGAYCPIDASPVIEGRPANQGIIRPEINFKARLDWPEAFYLVREKTRLAYTLEAPSDFALDARVSALTAAVQAALARCRVGH